MHKALQGKLLLSLPRFYITAMHIPSEIPKNMFLLNCTIGKLNWSEKRKVQIGEMYLDTL